MDLVEKDSELYPILSLFLVRMTGFEPTRLSTLEPETSASAVPPHPHIKTENESRRLIAFSLYYDNTTDIFCQGIFGRILKKKIPQKATEVLL